MAHVNRKANYDNKRNALINDATFSREEIEDVLELIRKCYEINLQYSARKDACILVFRF